MLFILGNHTKFLQIKDLQNLFENLNSVFARGIGWINEKRKAFKMYNFLVCFIVKLV